MASGFSMLPYLQRQQDPFSALLAGKLAAQKQREDQMKWLANYKMQLDRMAMSRAAASRAQASHDMNMKIAQQRLKMLRGGGAGVPGSRGGISQGLTSGTMGVPRPGYEGSVTVLPRGTTLARSPLDFVTQSPNNPFQRGTTDYYGGQDFTPRAPVVPGRIAPLPAQPANPFSTDAMGGYMPMSATGDAKDTGFTSPGALTTASLDAAIDPDAEPLDKDPYQLAADETDQTDNPFDFYA